jgi:hypothetical protein
MTLETITPEYAALNRQLHEEGFKYGSGSFKWDTTVAALREDTESDTVLDYGCGKGLLRKMLGKPDWLLEYDPAIPGKEICPDHADIVVCTDVLEHIEPALIDNVLKHLAKIAKKALFLVIASRPSTKFLADGRNAHLIQEGADWWRKKLEERFFVSSYESTGGEIVVTATPIRGLGTIIPKSAVSETIRFEQAIRNCSVVPGRVQQDESHIPRHDGRVCIVCYGPSLKDTWHSLRTERRMFGAKIVSVSGAHDFLIERGIVPDIHIECDPREHKAFFSRNSHPDVAYWIASCCHPALIDNLRSKGRNLALWHVFNSDTDRKIVDADGPDPNGWLICGGGSVGCRAVNVMYTQGFRTFSVYGMDCSFAPDGEQHAGVHSGKKQREWGGSKGGGIRVGNRWFRTSGTLVYTARGFIDNMHALENDGLTAGEPCIDGTNNRVEFFLHGDGLLAEMARHLMKNTIARETQAA